MDLLDILKQQLKVKLHKSKQKELQEIDDQLARLPYEYSPAILPLERTAWMARREQTVRAYALQRKARKALTRAKNSGGDQAKWEKAYRTAQASDAIIRELLIDKLQRKLMLENSAVFMLALALILVNFLLKASTSIDKEIINTWSESAAGLLLLLPLVSGVLRLGVSSHIHLLSSHRDSSDKVQQLASEANIELGMAGRRLADSNSLMSRLMNRRNNEETLDSIGCSEVPLELCCPIGKGVFTDPVYSDQSPQRFELTSMLTWLNVKNIHPLTKEELTPDNLKRDFSLKRQVDTFVERELEVSQKYAAARNALLRLSTFSEGEAGDTDGPDYSIKSFATGEYPR